MSRQSYLDDSQPVRAPAREDYSSYLSRKVREGSWFPKFRDFLRVMTNSESDLVLHLLNTAKVRADSAGWILATPRFVLAGLRMSPDRQQKCIDALTSRGFIEVDGPPQARRFRINTAQIERAIEEAREQTA